MACLSLVLLSLSQDILHFSFHFNPILAKFPNLFSELFLQEVVHNCLEGILGLLLSNPSRRLFLLAPFEFPHPPQFFQLLFLRTLPLLQILHFSFLLFNLRLPDGVLLLLPLDLLQSLSGKELLLLRQARETGLASSFSRLLWRLFGLRLIFIVVGALDLGLPFHGICIIADEVVDLWQTRSPRVALSCSWTTSTAIPVASVPPLLHVELLGMFLRLLVRFNNRTRRLLLLNPRGGSVVEAGRLLSRLIDLAVVLLLKALHLSRCLSPLFLFQLDLLLHLFLLLLRSLLFLDQDNFCLLLLARKLELELLHRSLLCLCQLLSGQLAFHLHLEELLLALPCLSLLAQVVFFGLLDLSKHFVLLLQLLSGRRFDQLLSVLLLLELAPQLLDDFECLLLLSLSLRLLQSTERFVALLEALKRFDPLGFVI